MYVYVDDVDRLVAKLRAEGVTVLRDPADMPWGERIATIADPDGKAGRPVQRARSVAGYPVPTAVASILDHHQHIRSCRNLHGERRRGQFAGGATERNSASSSRSGLTCLLKRGPQGVVARRIARASRSGTGVSPR